MNIEVSKDNVVILNKSESPHENEYNITECNFTFDEFTNSFQVKRAIFTVLSTGEMYEIDIVNGKCFTPVEVLKHEYETVKLGVYGYNIEIVDEKEVLKERFSPSYDTFVVPTGSYEEGALSPDIITPSQYDIYSQALQEGLDNVADALEEVSHVDIDAEQLEHGASVTITNRNNEEKTVEILDGEDGYTPVKGVDYFTTAEIEEIEGTVKEQVKTDLDFDNTVNRINQDILDLNTNKASKTELENEKNARELADTNLQSQIDAIESGKDVVDIVGTYSDLQNYDTSTLTEDDVIKVLDDSTHNNAMSYYRWASNTWNYIGSEGPFYTKSETDSLLNTKQATIDNSHKLASDLVDDANQTHKFTSTNEKNTWNAKYDKPSNGIPKSDLVASVQESLNKADTAIQDVSDKEDKSNKVTEINSSSTDTQYPSAKCVYDSQEEQNEQLAELEMLYNAFPTVSDEDTTIQLDNTAKVKFKEIDLKGNTSQVVIPEEQGTSVSNTSIYVSDVNTDKENTIEMSGNTYQETTSGINIYNVNGTQGQVSPEITIGSDFYVSCTYDNTSGSTVHYSNFMINRNDLLKTSTNYLIVAEIKSVSGSGRFYPFTKHNNSCIETENTNYPFSTLSAGDKILIPVTTKSEFTSNTRYDLRTLVAYAVGESGSITFRLSLLTDTTITSDTFVYEKFTYGPSPNPSYPQNISVVTGTQNITIANGDNTQSTTYSINLGNIELCKIDTYKDRIYKRNDKWYLEKKTGKVTLNGSEEWGTVQAYGRSWPVVEAPNILVSTGATDLPYLYCNYYNAYKLGDIVSSNPIDYGIGKRSNHSELLVRNKDADTVASLKTWLSTHNTIVYYALATPTTTEITDTTLVNQLNALYNATIYPITNINTDTSNLLPYIDLHYNFVTPSPSPSRPSIVNVVKGNNTITISNSDNTKSQVFPINIGDMELCKIGTYQDYIYESNGNWFKKGNIGKVVLNGSENWQTELYTYYLTNFNAKPYSTFSPTTPYAYANYFKWGNGSSGSFIEGSFWYTLDGSKLRVQKENPLDLNTFKTWLSTHNTIVYYALATPTDTQINDTTLITQLNNIKKAYSYDTQTNISQTNTDKPFIIYAEAIRSLKDVFE